MLRRFALVIATIVASRTATPAFAQALPPLPESVVSQLGPVRILIVPDLKCNGVAVYGCFDGVSRRIIIRDSMPREVQWHTLFHEQFHVMLHDGGVTLRNADGTISRLEDTLADVVATARLSELLVMLQRMAAELTTERPRPPTS